MRNRLQWLILTTMVIAALVPLLGLAIYITSSPNAKDFFINHTGTVLTIGICAAAGIAILGTLLLWIKIIRPIKRLTRAANLLQNGETAPQPIKTARNEIGDLIRAFNKLRNQSQTQLDRITRERSRLSTMFSYINDSIFIIDENRKVLMMNKAAETQFQIHDDLYDGDKTLIKIVRDYEIDNLVKKCIAENKQQTGLVELRSQNKIISVTVTPLSGEKRFMVRIQDYTELKKLQTIRQDFVANISHELRTPVASVKALAETLHEGALNDPVIAPDFLGKIVIETDKLSQMIEELGELSSIESGSVPIERKPTDLAKIINRSVERLTAQAERAGILLEIQSARLLPLVLADDHIEQVIINLVHNAIKFTVTGGKVTIAATVQDNSIIVSITDTGIGISEEDLPRVFERFYKADKARSGGGTGLGLAIAKHIISAYGGSIWAKSIEGKGSTFYFSLPMAI